MSADSLVHYQVVFDATAAGYRYWWLPGSGLVVTALGVWWLRAGKAIRELSIWAGLVLPTAIVVFALLWSVVSFAMTYPDYANLRRALRSGDYVTVEGTVEEFVPGDAGDHRPESFVIAGRRYVYSPSIITAGYDRTLPHGGRIKQGIRVKIADVNGEIARLEIAE